MNDISKYIDIPLLTKEKLEGKEGILPKISIDIEFSEKLENFLKYNLSEKTKIIEIGLNTYETSVEMTRNWAENDTEEAIKQTRKEKNKEIKKEKEKNKKHREKISELQEKLGKTIDEMEEKMEMMRNNIKRESDILNKTTLEGMKKELDECYNKLHCKDEEYYDRMKLLEGDLRDKHEGDLRKINEKNEKDLKEIHQTSVS